MPLKRSRRRLSSFQIILLGFAVAILCGACLLMLPIASNDGKVTPFCDALFTSTSAVCVTGLVVRDTAVYWSYFGQAVILLLIQIGGIGVITLAISISMVAGKKIGLGQRNTMQEAISAHYVGGIGRLAFFILRGALLVEAIGALIMMPVFCIDFGAKGIWMAVFHSISAFCNAGFDIMGTVSGEYTSLTRYATNPVISITIMLLIVIGGIGFLTWEDVCRHKWHIKRYRMQSKVILITTLILIVIPALYFFFFEFADVALGERVLLSLFQSVTPRTAGFNTAPLATISDVGLFVMIALMLVGGSPGSTAGGMKTTTIAVLFSSALSVFRKNEDTQLFKRRIPDTAVKQAVAVFQLYIVLFVSSGAAISKIENIPFATCLYETASAIGTVGLSLGITPTLGTVSKLILIALMFFGRVGGLTLIYAAFGSTRRKVSRYPLDKITIG